MRAFGPSLILIASLFFACQPGGKLFAPVGSLDAGTDAGTDGGTVAPGACQYDSDCAATDDCVASICTPPIHCANDAQCPSGDACIPKARSCAPGVDCPTLVVLTCEPKVATTSCAYDSDCSSDSFCVDAACYPRTACTTENDCPGTSFCGRHPVTCAPGDTSCAVTTVSLCEPLTQKTACQYDSDCQGGECFQNFCAPHMPCSTDSDCPASGICQLSAETCAPSLTCTAFTTLLCRPGVRLPVCASGGETCGACACPAGEYCYSPPPPVCTRGICPEYVAAPRCEPLPL